MTRAKAIQKLEALYAKVPRMDCKGACQSCCEPFRIGRVEWERIEERTGPLAVLDRKVCPMLSAEGKCSVHDIRPMLCRIWYTVRDNPCPHGCKPERWLEPDEARALLMAAHTISGGEFAGPEVEMRKLEAAMAALFQAENVCL